MAHSILPSATVATVAPSSFSEVAAARSAPSVWAAGRQAFAETPSGTPIVAVTAAAVCLNETGMLPLPVATVALIHWSDEGCGIKDILVHPGKMGFTPKRSRIMMEFGPEHHG